MCSRKRSRPSSKRRLTKNGKRLSWGRSVFASAIGVDDEHRLRTNGAALVAGAAPASAAALEAKLGVAVITSPKSPKYEIISATGRTGPVRIRGAGREVPTLAPAREAAAPPS